LVHPCLGSFRISAPWCRVWHWLSSSHQWSLGAQFVIAITTAVDASFQKRLTLSHYASALTAALGLVEVKTEVVPKAASLSVAAKVPMWEHALPRLVAN